MYATVEWKELSQPTSRKEEASSLAELNALLDRVAQANPPEPVLAVVTRTNGDTLSIGLGQPLICDDAGTNVAFEPPFPITVLSFVPQNLDPPYFTSAGTLVFPWRFVFYFGGHWTEFAFHNAIPVLEARRAVEFFVQAQAGLPGNIAWEQA